MESPLVKNTKLVEVNEREDMPTSNKLGLIMEGMYGIRVDLYGAYEPVRQNKNGFLLVCEPRAKLLVKSFLDNQECTSMAHLGTWTRVHRGSYDLLIIKWRGKACCQVIEEGEQ